MEPSRRTVNDQSSTVVHGEKPTKEDTSLKAFIDDISDLLCMIWMLITHGLGAPAVQYALP